MTGFERERGRIGISTSPTTLNIEAIHAYRRRSYWAEEIRGQVMPTRSIPRSDSGRGSSRIGTWSS